MTSPEFNNEKKRKDRQEPIAIVGMACIFPKADNLGEYWSNIVKKVDAITDIPSTHWKTEEFFNEDIKQPDHTYSQKGGFISPVPFDPLEFGIAPNAVEATDTSQLLGLVVAQQALNDAGYGKDRDFNREKVSVVLGVTGTLELVIPLGARLGHPRWRKALRDSGIDNTKSEEVVRRISDSYVGWQENSFPGLLGNVVAGRIANRLDFGGTNCVVDAACASSLSALHLGCLELGTGRSDMVITGGIDTFNDIFMYMCFSKTPVLSPTGHARPFDHKEDGTVLGEGIGMLILKRAGDAKRDKDKIYALIKGVGASSDGKGNAIYMPTSRGQSRALKDAYKRAGVTPESIGLVEAHGTGTKVGDATEVNALASVYSGGEKKDSWCALGSVKSQIGHTKAAAGMAGVIKSVMALQNKVLPPTIKVEKPIKEASPETTPFYINTESRPWLNDQETPRRAAVSAFGFGGSNFHCVLEEYHPEKISATWDYDIEVLAFSSSTVEGLCQQLRLFPRDLPWVQAVQEGSRIRREFNSSDSCRMAMVVTRNGKTIPQVVSGALQMLERSPEKKEWATPDNVFFENKESSSEKLGVIFPGQGSQYCGMLRDLACAFPSFHTALERADRSFRKLQGSNPGKKITDFIYPHSSFDEPTQQKGEKELRRTNVAQPSIGAVSLGAFRVLEEFGVSPVAFSGHSFGELTALSASGRLSEEDFFVLSSIRGDLMNAQSETEGGMIAVRWSEKNVEKFLLDEELDLVIANRNSPNQTVLSGPVKEIKKAAEVFLKNRVSHIQLPVSGAFHSPLVSSCKEPFFQSVKGVRLKSDFKPVFSNTTGSPYPKKSMDAKKLLSGQLAEPVEFVKLIENMYSAGVTTFLEVGPGSKLSKLILEILHAKPVKALSLDATSGKGSGLHDLAITLARLVTAGHNLDLSLWNPGVSGEKDLKNKKKVMTIPVCGANHFKPRETRTTAGVRSSSGSTAETTNNTIGRKKEVQVAAEKNGRGREKNARDLTVQTRPFSDTGNSGNNAVSRALQATQESMLALQKMQEEAARLHSQFLEGQNRAQEALVALIDRQQSFFAGKERKNVPVTTVSPEPPTQKENGKRDSEKKEELSKNSFGTSIEKREGGNGKLPETEKTEGKVVQALLGVLSEKTGYPVEMLDLEMKMDSDLGIDSIKQVEILSALQERLPGSPEVGPEQMGKLQTLNQLALYLSAGLAKNGEKLNMEKDPPSVSAANGEVHTALLEIVSEKTGYPVEMLDLDMGMDSDLGIDSIKQVEILSGLQERLPGSPEVEPEQMGKIQTLRDLAIHLAAGQESPRENDKEHFASHGGPPEEASFVHTTLLEIVSEKTGYPVEMLNLEMTMDSDLGIDSIKQVEILSALQERLPGSPEVEPDQLGRLQTLEDLASFLKSNLPGQDSPPETSCTSGSGKKETSEIENVVLSVVSDKTGYPAEMLELDMGMDSDLGIDSIKQVEILSALSERLPDSPEVKPDQFGTLNTLRQLAMFLGASGNEPPNQVEEEKAKSEKAKEENHFDSIQRSVLVVEGLEPLAGREKVCIENGSPIWIVSDGSDLPMRVAEKLEGYGYRPVLLDFA
ncbi:MAG: beta-ketoacyl synthase N-terminal-like domain-containing protein, partial [Nitrospinota bacterium]